MSLLAPAFSTQHAIRTARAELGYKESLDGQFELLIGVPFLIRSSGPPLKDSESWAYEASVSYSFALHDLEFELSLSPRPVSARAVGGLVGTQFLGALQNGVSIDGPGAYLWPGALRGPVAKREACSSLFFRMDSLAFSRFGVSCLRLEALMEEQGVKAKLFPPTAIWNSPSLARLAHLRHVAQSLSRTAGEVSAHRLATELILCVNDEPAQSFQLPEELDADITAALKQVGVTRFKRSS